MTAELELGDRACNSDSKVSTSVKGSINGGRKEQKRSRKVIKIW